MLLARLTPLTPPPPLLPLQASPATARSLRTLFVQFPKCAGRQPHLEVQRGTFKLCIQHLLGQRNGLPADGKFDELHAIDCQEQVRPKGVPLRWRMLTQL
jgi:hypothetical protein